jgi:hypothetical protein
MVEVVVLVFIITLLFRSCYQSGIFGFSRIQTLWELGRQMMYEMIGDPVKDKELLTAISPVFHANKIKAPLLVAHGANDPRAKKLNLARLCRPLRKGTSMCSTWSKITFWSSSRHLRINFPIYITYRFKLFPKKHKRE